MHAPWLSRVAVGHGYFAIGVFAAKGQLLMLADTMAALGMEAGFPVVKLAPVGYPACAGRAGGCDVRAGGIRCVGTVRIHQTDAAINYNRTFG